MSADSSTREPISPKADLGDNKPAYAPTVVFRLDSRAPSNTATAQLQLELHVLDVRELDLQATGAAAAVSEVDLAKRFGRQVAQLLFQVLTEREERASVAIASNESFGGWTKTFTDPRLCAAIVDRLTFGGNIIETGTDSYRLAHTKNQQGSG